MLKIKQVLLVAFFGLSTCVQKIYGEWNAQEYATSNGGQFKYALQELPKLGLKGSELILDVGCGNGAISLYIAREYVPRGEVEGLDNDNGMITCAVTNTHPHASNISFICADILEYTSEKQYDAVVSFWCLHWVLDYVGALKNIAQLLRPGGKALICHVIDYNPLERWVAEVLSKQEWAALRPLYTKMLQPPSLEIVIDALRQSALIIEHIEIKKNAEWVPFDVYKKNLLSTPLFNFVPLEWRDQFVQDVLKESMHDAPVHEQGYVGSRKSSILYWLPVIVMIVSK